MESAKLKNISKKIAFLANQNRIILFDYLFFYTQSLASLISKGEQIINFREQEYYSTTKSEIIESRISFTDRKMDNIEKLNKLRNRSIISFKIFLFSTAFYFYFIWKDNLYFSYIMLLACLVSLIFSIPLVRLHSFFENDVRDRLTKYKMYLNSEKEKISKTKKKEDANLKVPIIAEVNMTGVLFFLFIKNDLINNEISTSYIKSIFSTIFSKKNGSQFKLDSFGNSFVLTENDDNIVWTLYSELLKQLATTTTSESYKESFETSQETQLNTKRLFYQLKNTSLEFKIPDEQLEVLLKVYCNKILAENKETINLNKFEQSHLRNLLKSHF